MCPRIADQNKYIRFLLKLQIDKFVPWPNMEHPTGCEQFLRRISISIHEQDRSMCKKNGANQRVFSKGWTHHAKEHMQNSRKNISCAFILNVHLRPGKTLQISGSTGIHHTGSTEGVRGAQQAGWCGFSTTAAVQESKGYIKPFNRYKTYIYIQRKVYKISARQQNWCKLKKVLRSPHLFHLHKSHQSRVLGVPSHLLSW